MGSRPCTVEIRAKEAGVIAGVAEAAWIYDRSRRQRRRLSVTAATPAAGDVILRITGDARSLLTLQRTVVNLMQRMSGIADGDEETGCCGPANSLVTAHVVGTRKTAWGLLDKRAIYCGKGGTHRLNLGNDADLWSKRITCRLASNEVANASSGSRRRFPS